MNANPRKIKLILKGRLYGRRITPHSLLTCLEATNVLGITRRHVYNLIKNGDLKPIRRGKGRLKRLFFVFNDLQKYLEGR
jgi:excisionase family DNA binding protein